MELNFRKVKRRSWQLSRHEFLQTSEKFAEHWEKSIETAEIFMIVGACTLLAGGIKTEMQYKQDTVETTRLNAQFSQEENKIPMPLAFSSLSRCSSAFIFSCPRVIFLLVPLLPPGLFFLRLLPRLLAFLPFSDA